MTLLQAVVLAFWVQLSTFLVIVMIGLYLLSRDERDGLCSENPNNAAIPDLRIWRSYSQGGAGDDAPRIALIAKDSVQTQQIATYLAQQGYDIHHTTDVDAMFETVQTHPVDWEFMIFDLELLDDLESNVDDLMMFREDCARIPILLLSGSITKDGFSDYRRAIGDATLRKPVFRSQLLDGIAAMKTNWQAREFV
jgi:CheY-like chemotaxis protein